MFQSLLRLQRYQNALLQGVAGEPSRLVCQLAYFECRNGHTSAWQEFVRYQQSPT